MSTSSDGTVQLPPDSTGKNLDTTEITRLDATVVERQRVEVPDATAYLAELVALMTRALAELSTLRQLVASLLDVDELGDALVADTLAEDVA